MAEKSLVGADGGDGGFAAGVVINSSVQISFELKNERFSPQPTAIFRLAEDNKD